MASRSDNTAETARRIKLAGYQRLLSHIHVDPPLVDQTHIMKLAEQRVYDYTKALPSTRDGAVVYEGVRTILTPFEFKQKPAYLGLWEFVTCGRGTADLVKTHLEGLQSVAFNNKLKRLIPPQLQTIAKYTGLVKHILNYGKPFQSLFDEVDLSKSEQIQRTHAKGLDLEAREDLEALLEGQTFESDENHLLRKFYTHVDILTDPVLRNSYFNRMLAQLIPRIGTQTRLISLFAQVYCHLVNKELVSTVDPVVTRYLAEHPVDFFSHSLRHMGLILEPHSNFKQPTLVLEDWQRNCCRAIRAEHNVLVSAPPSAGKTFVSTEVINAYDDAWYVVPTKPLADQLAGILLATLEDNERKKGVAPRNLRLELEGVAGAAAAAAAGAGASAAAETKTAYRRFYRAKDNLVVATPRRLWDLLRSKQAPPNPRYLILDEFHNLSCPVLGPFYEALFLYAAFHKIRVVALTGTMRNTDFDPIRTWFERTLAGPLFAVMIQKRFFNQRRVVFRVTGERVAVAALDPLDHLRLETVRSPTFRHPGLIPSAVLRLYGKLPDFPRVDERVPVLPTLDEVDAFEGRLFAHVAAQSDAVLSDLLKERPVSSDALTLDQIHTTLCAMDAQWKPLLFFKMDPHECMHFFQTFIQFIQDKNELVYGTFQEDQPIVEQYLEDVVDMNHPEGEEEGKERESEKAVANAEQRRVKWETLYTMKYLPKLRKFYKEYQDPAPAPAKLEAFNAKYGASLTHEAIVAKRAAHVAKQLAIPYDRVRLRRNYEIHDDIKISNYSESAIMKDIRAQINDELAHYRRHHGAFTDMEAEFDDFNEIEETRTWKNGFAETRRMGRPWPSVAARPAKDDDPAWAYTYMISYKHPVMVAAECGLLFYNELLNPALSYIAQLLISRHPLVFVSDRTLTSGINYPFKTVWLQGGLKGEPTEVLDNTTAFQGMGRAGRRGLEKEATIITNGVDIPSILTPHYNPMGRNEAGLMEEILGSDELRLFARTGERVAPVAAATAAAAAAAATAATVAATVAATATAVPVEEVAAVAVENVLNFVAGPVVKTGTWEDLLYEDFLVPT